MADGRQQVSEGELRQRLSALAERTQGFPQILNVSCAEEEVRVRLEIASDLSWFAGHFPEFAVLPGVVQLHWAVLCCRAAFGLSGSPLEIKRLKFKRPVTPPRDVELVMSVHGEREAQFAFHSSDEQNSEGRLIFSGRG